MGKVGAWMGTPLERGGAVGTGQVCMEGVGGQVALNGQNDPNSLHMLLHNGGSSGKG